MLPRNRIKLHRSCGTFVEPRNQQQANANGSNVQNAALSRSRAGQICYRPQNIVRYAQAQTQTGAIVPQQLRHVHPIRQVEEIFDEDRELARHYKVVPESDQNISVFDDDQLSYVVSEAVEWSKFRLLAPIQRNVERSCYTTARKIQAAAVPLIITAHDVVIQSEAGTGKTAAYMVPIIHRLLLGNHNKDSQQPRALIISPTRELSLQLYEQARKFVADTTLRVMIAYGQEDLRFEVQQINQGVDIIIGTMGRIGHLLERRSINPNRLECLVLDEADFLVDQEDFAVIMHYLEDRAHWIEQTVRQTILVSATFEDELGPKYLNLLRRGYLRLKNVEKICFSKRIHHQFVRVRYNRIKDVILDWILHMTKILSTTPRILIFMESKVDTEELEIHLRINGVNAVAVTSLKAQSEREERIKQFRMGKHKILLASNLIARGLDFGPLDYIINAMLPMQDVEQFRHRLGRVGRVRKGHVVTMVPTWLGIRGNNLLSIIEEIVQALSTKANSCEICEFVWDEQWRQCALEA